jgi:hypothetical protein
MTEPATMPAQGDAEPDADRLWCSEEGCRVPETFLHTSTVDGLLYCTSHDPDPVVANARRLGQQRGALRSQMRHKRGLDPNELGPLTTLADATRHLAISCEAVSTGRISPAVSNAIDRKVSLFLKTRDLDQRETRLSRLEVEIERLKAQVGR